MIGKWMILQGILAGKSTIDWLTSMMFPANESSMESSGISQPRRRLAARGKPNFVGIFVIYIYIYIPQTNA